MLPENRKGLYNTVLSQAISSCGNYLFTGNNYGEIHVFNIPQVCTGPPDQEGNEDRVKYNQQIQAIQVFKVSERNHSQVNSLAFHNDFLIVGTTNDIAGFKWSEAKHQIILPKKAWEIKLSHGTDSLEQVEVNSLFMSPNNSLLYAGCGNNVMYCISLDDGRITRDFTGHTDYIHCVHGNEALYTASEDGSIKFWDARAQKAVGGVEPYKNEKLNRPELGKWQGCVAATDDWLVCGGATLPALFHLRAMEFTTVFDFPEKAYCTGFLDDVIFVAGDHSSLDQFNMNGNKVAAVPISGPSAYSVVWQTEPQKFLSIGGASNSLDICTDFKFKDIVLPVYKTLKNL